MLIDIDLKNSDTLSLSPGNGGYRVEDIGNGNFEVLWKNGCNADYGVRGRSIGYTQCNDGMNRGSDEVERAQRRWHGALTQRVAGFARRAVKLRSGVAFRPARPQS